MKSVQCEPLRIEYYPSQELGTDSNKLSPNKQFS